MYGQDDSQQDDNQHPEDSTQGAMQGDMPAGDNPAPQTSDDNDWGHPGTPTTDTPAVVEPEIPEPAMPAPAMDTPTEPTPVVNSLLSLDDIKQKALGELSPLLKHLDQTPEDKFRTTMMMIQATDDKSLVSSAYEAANAIPDEKAKSQALLDVINEINYFEHKA